VSEKNPNGTRKEEYGSINIAIAVWILIKQKANFQEGCVCKNVNKPDKNQISPEQENRSRQVSRISMENPTRFPV